MSPPRKARIVGIRKKKGVTSKRGKIHEGGRKRGHTTVILGEFKTARQKIPLRKLPDTTLISRLQDGVPCKKKTVLVALTWGSVKTKKRRGSYEWGPTKGGGLKGENENVYPCTDQQNSSVQSSLPRVKKPGQ